NDIPFVSRLRIADITRVQMDRSGIVRLRPRGVGRWRHGLWRVGLRIRLWAAPFHFAINKKMLKCCDLAPPDCLSDIGIRRQIGLSVEQWPYRPVLAPTIFNEVF